MTDMDHKQEIATQVYQAVYKAVDELNLKEGYEVRIFWSGIVEVGGVSFFGDSEDYW